MLRNVLEGESVCDLRGNLGEMTCDPRSQSDLRVHRSLAYLDEERVVGVGLDSCRNGTLEK